MVGLPKWNRLIFCISVYLLVLGEGDVENAHCTFQALINSLMLFSDESLLIQEANRQPPHKIDENMWKNREHIEEIVALLDRSRWPAEVTISYLINKMAFFFSFLGSLQHLLPYRLPCHWLYSQFHLYLL